MATRKVATTVKSKVKALEIPIRALYAVPIYDAIKRGDQKEMKALAAQARKQISEVKAALAALEKKIGA
jgi:hypothetical protein